VNPTVVSLACKPALRLCAADDGSIRRASPDDLSIRRCAEFTGNSGYDMTTHAATGARENGEMED
jgi:hypothetical protein